LIKQRVGEIKNAEIERKKVQKKPVELPLNIVLEKQKKLNVSGIYDVDSFDESSSRYIQTRFLRQSTGMISTSANEY
jgi:hypothetical protein